jgi:hypothetical protein
MEETFKYRKLDMLIISIQSHKKVVGAENVVSAIVRSLMVRFLLQRVLHDYTYAVVVSYILQGSIWLSSADWGLIS